MSSGKQPPAQTQSNRPPPQFDFAFGQLGQGAANLLSDINNKKSFLQLTPRQRRQQGLGSIGNADTGIERGVLESTFNTGGFTPFTSDDKRAFSLARGLSGSDRAIGQAGNIFSNNQGASGLNAIDIGRRQEGAQTALSNFDSQALRGLDFQGLEATARGDFLDVANNPFLGRALDDAQRRTTDRFTQDVQPALASQFGGGFGLTGSGSINAQRRAAEDLSRSLSEQATSTFANQFNRERGFQESARSQLGQLGLSRAQGIDANQLSRANSLGQLGLGFTQADIQRGTNLGNIQNQQGQGLLQTGQARRGQETQRIGLLNSIGQQQRQAAQDLFNRQQAVFNAPIDEQTRRLNNAAGILGVSNGLGSTTTIQGGGGGGGGAGGALGGALTGGALGSAFGPLGGGIGAIGGGLLGLF